MSLGCDIVLTANDLSYLAIDQEPPADELAKFNRLRLGYCARSSCDSRYYRIRVIEAGGLDWSALLKRALELGTQKAPASTAFEEPEPPDSGVPPAPPARRRRLLLAGLALLAAVTLWHFWDDLPFHSEPPPKYRIDPSSLPRY